MPIKKPSLKSLTAKTFITTCGRLLNRLGGRTVGALRALDDAAANVICRSLTTQPRPTGTDAEYEVPCPCHGSVDCRGKTYIVQWVNEIDATGAWEAAQEALDQLRDPDSTATVFTVTGPDGSEANIDLLEDYTSTPADTGVLEADV